MYSKFLVDTKGGGIGIHLGGKPYIEDACLWPVIPNTTKKQILLLTLDAKYFRKPSYIVDDCCISIFISYDKETNYTSQYTVNSGTELHLSSQYTTVLYHKKSHQPINVTDYNELPLLHITYNKMSELEYANDILGVTKGSQLSKNIGSPGWLQDKIYTIPPKYQFELQLNEFDLRKVNNEYDGIFNDGIGYLFLFQSLKKIEQPNNCGLFFIQDT